MGKNIHLYLSAAGLLLLLIVALVAPMLSPYTYDLTDLSNANLPPSALHWFGTDSLGRDLWTRVWVGSRVTLWVGLLGAIFPQILGWVVGGTAGYFGGWSDIILMFLADVGTGIPSLVYVTLIYLTLGSGSFSMLIAITISSWMEPARIARSRFLQSRNREFLIAARLQGATAPYIMIYHIMPIITGQMIVNLFSAVPGAIFVEAYLSFIGMGISSPGISLGQLCQTGVSFYRLYPYQLFFPGIVISVMVLMFYLLGNGLRDITDPRSQGSDLL